MRLRRLFDGPAERGLADLGSSARASVLFRSVTRGKRQCPESGPQRAWKGARPVSRRGQSSDPTRSRRARSPTIPAASLPRVDGAEMRSRWDIQHAAGSSDHELLDAQHHADAAAGGPDLRHEPRLDRVRSPKCLYARRR